ncbi:MAG: phosphodiester glycosidase family protein [Nanoarchaeota archaeon]|nr:phosphodiester glycosidase family protein [Nanoarchaeota archaeon]
MNRTVVAKDYEGNIIFFTTEGGFFTLFNFGRFLRDEGKEYDIHTAMNSDGGYETQMCVRTPNFTCTTYGQFETYGPNRNVSIKNARIPIPGVIGVFPRE